MEHLRSYEISVWTLQDSFITVLKPSNLETKGQLIEPNMVLKDDGDSKLSFKIPMYIRNDLGEMVENPLWYNITDGIIIASLRKVKVIFNKATPDEGVFEFLIINVKEEHEGLKKYCSVECEGLAFHELGKQGYKITLEGSEEIASMQKNFFEENQSSASEYPQPTINYWADRVFENSNWSYKIEMDWSAQDGIVHQIYTNADIPALSSNQVLDSDEYSSFSEAERDLFNNKREQDGLRRRDKIYEDSYVSSWIYDEDKEELVPSAVQEEREKYRPIEASESNRYNLSQTIAEIFQVYCKYKYYYDDNYHIIKREVIFYNNFLNESSGVIDLTYKYNTEHLSRIMDASDTINKMYVRPLKDEDMPSGEALISDTEANKSKEDYLLNFDYLYNIGTITKEQYDEIEPYYVKLYSLNKEYIKISNDLRTKEREKITQESRKKTYSDMHETDSENIGRNDALAQSIGDENGNINITADNPDSLFLIPEEGKSTYYCNFEFKGILRNGNFHLYWDREYNKNTKKYECKNELKIYTLIEDDFGGVIKAINISKANGHESRNVIYGVYDYSPDTYYNTVSKIYQIRLAQDDAIVEEASQKLDGNESTGEIGLYKEIENLEARQKEILEEKSNIINSFERMMGPALREGKWQPEDEYYRNFGELHEEEIILTANATLPTLETLTQNGEVYLGWDNELFDEEQDFTYKFGAILADYYYPCIKISETLLNTFTSGSYNITNFLTELTLIYKNSLYGTDQNIKQYIAINSKMKIGFLREKTTKNVFPVLMIIDADKMTSEQLSLLNSTGYLAYISSDISTGVVQEKKTYVLNVSDWLIKPTEVSNENIGGKYETVFPRFVIDSLMVKNYETEIGIKRNNIALNNYKDFEIIPRVANYTVTIKPETFFASKDALSFNIPYSIYYTISMTPLAIYLDAVNILRENAFPKVSYEIDLISTNKDFVYNNYQRLGQIAHINDYELKFENTLGYISELNLNLENPWKDKVIVKNYKTKFEDLFSTIVAQTEQMKKNTSVITLAANAFNSDGTLSENAIGNSLFDEFSARTIANFFKIEIPTPAAEYAKYEPIIKQELKQVYDDAGQILAAATKSVDDVAELNLKNAAILGTFKESIRENLTPTNFIDKDSKRYNQDLSSFVENFKVGDIWEHNGSTYMATENSHQISYSASENKLTSLKGWSLVQDGSLAQIKGANLDINAKTGKIQILAENEINIASGGLLKLAGQDVKIIGNKTVEIGGPDVKIYSANKGETANTNKGIHIYSSVLGASASTSAVDITGNGIVVGSAGKIDIKSAAGINIYTSDTSSVSAIKINRDEGIYIGSSKQIRLYSGEINGNGTSALISPERILFGVNGASTGTAVDLTKDYIVFGAGDVTTNHSNIGTKAGAAGIQINQTSIKMATGTADTSTRNYINMDSSGVTIANAANETNGAIVKISNGGVLIGTATKETTFTNKIKNNQSATDTTTAKFQVYAPNFVVNASGQLFVYDANIAGTIRARTLYIGNSTTNMIVDNKIEFNAINNTDDLARIKLDDGYITLTSVDLKTKTESSQVKIGPNKIYLGSTGNLEINTGNFTIDSQRNVKVDGKIYTKEGLIGGWQIDETSIHTKDVDITNNTNGSVGFSSENFTRTVTGLSVPNLRLAIGSTFGVTSSGKLYASNVLISGYITATSGSFAGKIAAKSGSIGGWTIGTLNEGTSYEHNYITTNPNRTYYDDTSNAGMTLDSSGISAIASEDQYFYLSSQGYLSATGVSIKGTIRATSLYIGDSQTALSVSNGKINLGAINENEDLAKISVSADGWISLYSSNHSSDTINNGSLIRIGQNKIYMNTDDIRIISKNFQVNSDYYPGSVYVEGTIRATALYVGNSTAALQVTDDGRISINSIGPISLNNLTDTGNIATINLDGGWLTLSSKDGSKVFGTSSIHIGPEHISIDTQNIFINSPNFYVKGDVGDVRITGNINATSGSIGDFYINNGKMVRGNGSKKTVLNKNGLKVIGKKYYYDFNPYGFIIGYASDGENDVSDSAQDEMSVSMLPIFELKVSNNGHQCEMIFQDKTIFKSIFNDDGTVSTTFYN